MQTLRNACQPTVSKESRRVVDFHHGGIRHVHGLSNSVIVSGDLQTERCIRLGQSESTGIRDCSDYHRNRWLDHNAQQSEVNKHQICVSLGRCFPDVSKWHRRVMIHRSVEGYGTCRQPEENGTTLVDSLTWRE